MWQGHFCVEKIIDDYYGGIFNLTKYQIDTIIMIISNIFSEPLLFLFITISYHSELSLTFLETKFPKHKIIILTTELNNPIAVAYEY